jgi:hypothetical protein
MKGIGVWQHGWGTVLAYSNVGNARYLQRLRRTERIVKPLKFSVLRFTRIVCCSPREAARTRSISDEDHVKNTCVSFLLSPLSSIGSEQTRAMEESPPQLSHVVKGSDDGEKQPRTTGSFSMRDTVLGALASTGKEIGNEAD